MGQQVVNQQTGELLHVVGADGARRAKKWLDATTRVSASWLASDPVQASKLSFKWPHSTYTFSYDIGGILRGGEFQNQHFVAECKKYTAAHDQGTLYMEYLAKCYVAHRENRAITDHFLWLTWHPFLVGKWNTLCSADLIVEAVIGERVRIFGTSDADAARAQIDLEHAEEVAQKLWVIVLSDRQEKLVITPEHRALIMQAEILKEASA